MEPKDSNPDFIHAIDSRRVWWTGPEAGDWSPASAANRDYASGLVSSLVISVVVRRPTGLGSHWRSVSSGRRLVGDGFGHVELTLGDQPQELGTPRARLRVSRPASVVRARVLSQTAEGECSPWGIESTLRILADTGSWWSQPSARATREKCSRSSKTSERRGRGLSRRRCPQGHEEVDGSS
jgi:hypothetical protein